MKYPTNIQGTISELKVALDLTKKGYYVFSPFAINPPCDLLVFKDGETPKRVEVKTSSYNKGGHPVCARNAHKYDILASVMPDNKIIYREIE